MRKSRCAVRSGYHQVHSMLGSPCPLAHQQSSSRDLESTGSHRGAESLCERQRASGQALALQTRPKTRRGHRLTASPSRAQENMTLRAAVEKCQAGAAALKQAVQQIRGEQAMTEASAGQLLAALDGDKAVVRATLLERRRPAQRAQPRSMDVLQQLYMGALRSHPRSLRAVGLSWKLLEASCEPEASDSEAYCTDVWCRREPSLHGRAPTLRADCMSLRQSQGDQSGAHCSLQAAGSPASGLHVAPAGLLPSFHTICIPRWTHAQSRLWAPRCERPHSEL